MSVKLEKLDNIKFLLNYRNRDNTYLKVITSCLCFFSLLSTPLRLLLSAVIVQWKRHIMMTIQHCSPCVFSVIWVAWNQLWREQRHHIDWQILQISGDQHFMNTHCHVSLWRNQSPHLLMKELIRPEVTAHFPTYFSNLTQVYPGSTPLLYAQLLSPIFKVILPQIGTVLTLTGPMSLMVLCKFLGRSQYTLGAQ